VTETTKSIHTDILPLSWHSSLWASFNDRITNQRLPHALMLNALDGLGAENLAHAMAYRLLCNNLQSGVACGQCHGCSTLSAGTHPDFFDISPEEKGKPILVQQIRTLCESMAKTSQQGGWKVVVINPANSMNRNAANALLKSLEEPESNTFIILVSNRLSSVPMTIRSRCQIETLAVPSYEMGSRWLSSKVDDKSLNIEQALRIANGLPLLALSYLQGNDLESRQKVESFLEDMRLSNDETPFSVAQACQKYPPDDLIAWILSYVHLLMVGEFQNNPNPALFLFLDKLIQARAWLLSSANINTQLLWEELFIEWSQIFKVKK
jgi:DNA polymerase-3 subunit delta'